MSKIHNKGVTIKPKNELSKTILNVLHDMLNDRIVDAVLIPMRVPAKDSYAWILVKDGELLDDANPVAPIMPVQGAKALSSFLRKGEPALKIAAVLKPCEIRAVIELSKLNQINLENVTLISYDCPGTFSMKDYLNDPEKAEKKFKELLKKLNFYHTSIKSVCHICDEFSLLPVSDLHFGFFGNGDNSVLLIPSSKQGEHILQEMKMEPSQDISEWSQTIENIRKKRLTNKQERFKQIKNMVEGLDSLRDTFSSCIGCHNCRSACPVCYCRQCYFESETAKIESDMMMFKAKNRGSISFPLDRIMFQVGRMSHMSLSCVSCGLCTDACPVSIPVAEIFSYVSNNTQEKFGYKSGQDKEEPIPLKTFKLEETKGIKELVEDAEG
ncbi:MAG: 4Fe-4S dicluster domain-containing protein [bacterium]